jgi:hypothetical protein
MSESCNEIRRHFSEFMEGWCAPEVAKSIRGHLGRCAGCREELDRTELISSDLASLPKRRVPPHVALQLRVRMSQTLHRDIFRRFWVFVENTLHPVLIPASGGMLTAIVFFGLIMGTNVVPVINTPDVPLNVVTPARVRELAPITINADEQPVLVLTDIDADGNVRGYRVLSGQKSPQLMDELDHLIYFSVFQPATSFGRPTDGQVVLALRRITVRG